MSQTDVSFEAITVALRSLYSDAIATVDFQRSEHTLVLSLPTDIAAFSVFNGSVSSEFDAAYGEFKHLYRQHHDAWDKLTLSFVVCRLCERPEDDRFYASLEHDPLFCRKYVIRAFDDAASQRKELLRLPFLPLPNDGEGVLRRPQSAQDLLQSAGLSASLSRKLIETGYRSPERIASALADGSEVFPAKVERRQGSRVTLTKPRTYSKLVSANIEGFRAYRNAQEFDLDASVVVLYGPNGLGKTSFFDALDFACTGRIARLCRHQPRNQADFSRLATHLDKTPGTGSVVLNGRNEGNGEPEEWVLKRGTGDWARAWIGAQEHDRKQVLSFLTHANWLDARPRQQTYESLFRATHLFGQDEQELLIEFRKGSVIPENFISEMLALQDYSQGLTKVKSVVAQLGTELRKVADQIEELNGQIRAVSGAITGPIPEQTEAAPQPIDTLIDDLRNTSLEYNLSDSLPSGNVSLELLEQWSEMMAAQLRAANERHGVVTALLQELPGHRRLLEDVRRNQAFLAEVDLQIEALDAQVRDRNARLQSHRDVLSQQDTARQQSEQRRRDVVAALQGQAKRADASRRADALREELNTQLKLRADLDDQLRDVEAAVSKALGDHAEAREAAVRAKKAVDALVGVIESFDSYERNRAAYSGAVAGKAQAEEGVREAERGYQESEQRVREAAASREALLPAYERAVANQAELERLLDDIQAHVQDETCPLCGSSFESLPALLERIRERRGSIAGEQDAARRYNAALMKERELTTQLQALSATLSAARSNLSDQHRMAAESGAGVTAYEESVAAAIGEFSGDISKPVLATRHRMAAESLKQAEEGAATVKRALNDCEEAKKTTTARRMSVNERVIELERNIQTLSEEIAKTERSVAAVLDRENISEQQIEGLSDEITKVIDESQAKTELVQHAIKQENLGLDDVKKQATEAMNRRTQLLATIGTQQQATADVRRRLAGVGANDEVDSDALIDIASGATDHADRIRDLLDRAQVIVEALRARIRRLDIADKQAKLKELQTAAGKLAVQKETIERNTAGCGSVEKLLNVERQSAIEAHIGAYGPLITNIQQRLRSVYGFGGIQLQARGGEAAVQVEWRNKNVQVPPTDFFSDSQKQILMLSIFLAGGLRQNWSGFAPVLLDDPVTHFDDLNAYGFIELVRGIISSHPTAWQFIISTCEERLFALMEKKFARVSGGAIFYEFLGMTEGGPIVERR